MVGNLLGYEVFRLRTGVLPAETRRQVLVQDLASLDVTAQPLLPDPRCPFCAPEPAPAPALDRAAVARWQPAESAAEPADDGDRALAALEARSVLVQPDTGPFPGWADESWTQLPLKVGSVQVALGPGTRRTDQRGRPAARRRGAAAGAADGGGGLRRACRAGRRRGAGRRAHRRAGPAGDRERRRVPPRAPGWPPSRC